MKRLYSLAAVALLTLAACNKAEMPGYLSDPDAVRIEAAVGTLTRSNPMGDADSQKKFNAGDRISVSNAGITVVYKLGEDGKWTPEDQTKYLRWDKNDLKFTAKYPADYGSLQSDQSTLEKMAMADYMTAAWTVDAIPSNHILNVALTRQNVLVKVKIAGYREQYKEGETTISYLSFGGNWEGVEKGKLMVSSSLVQDEKGNYKEEPYFDKGTVGYTYSGIVKPNAKGDNSSGDFICMEVKGYGTDTYGDILVVKGGQELLAGHAYTFNIYVGKNSVKVGSVTVNEWDTGMPIDDGETDAPDTWDGKSTETFATTGSDGSTLGDSETSPILIRTAAQLAYLAQKVNAGERFSGNVKNIERYAGGVVGQLIGKSVMENCTAEVKLNGRMHVGGLCGYIYESNILECTVMAGSTMGVSVDGNTTEYPCVGGLVGFIQGSNSTIKKCITYATVSGLGKVGGAFGHIEAAGGHKISDCTVLGDVAVSVVPDFITDAYQGIGGFAGCLAGGNVAESKFSNCGVNGTVGKVNGESFTKGSIYGAFIGHDGSIATFTDCWYNADKTGELDAIGDNQTKTGITAKNLGK